MAKKIEHTYRQDEPEEDRTQGIASILANGYLRLLSGVSSCEIAKSGQNSPEKGPSEALDLSGDQSDELEAG